MSEQKLQLEIKLFNLYTLDIEQQKAGIQFFRDLFGEKLLEEFGPLFKKRILGLYDLGAVPMGLYREIENALLAYELLTYQFILFAEKKSSRMYYFWEAAKMGHLGVFEQVERRLLRIWDRYKHPGYYDRYCKVLLEEHQSNLEAYICRIEPQVIADCNGQ